MELISALRPQRALLMLGLLIRVSLLTATVPAIYLDWFLPFLAHVPHAGGVDLWSSFLADGGPAVAFPYGPLYLVAFGPLTWLLGQFGTRGAAMGLGLSVLALDILLCGTLLRLVGKERGPTIVYSYWLSPIVVYVCYWHGQLDVLPVLLLTHALLLLRRMRFRASGLVLGLAASAKLSMGLAIPFVWMHALTTARLRPVARDLVDATLAGLATLLPFVLLAGFRRMVLDTPEKEKVFALAVPYAADLDFYVVPLAFLALLALAWRIRRYNFDVLFNLIGTGFFVLFLLTPASPGWAMWLMPFLVRHVAGSARSGRVLAVSFGLLFVAYHLVTSSGPAELSLAALPLPTHVRNLMLSAYLAIGGALAFRIFRRGIVDDPFYRGTRRPLVVGIAGDSGSGKDTLAAALIGLFSTGASSLVSGDDYHLWDRHKPMWRALTHLNPRANDLRRFVGNTLALAADRPVQAPHYDHALGAMTKPRITRSGDIVVAAGLHTLHSRELVAACDLRIFLAMDEDLRRYLKIRRDVLVRGHLVETVLASLERRQGDGDRYIRPQADMADLILSLGPVDEPSRLDPLAAAAEPRMRLAIETADPLDLASLIRGLVSIAGLSAVEETGRFRPARVVIEGDPTAADIAAVAAATMPDVFDYLAMAPVWQPGLVGVMQLTSLHQLADRLRRHGPMRAWT